MQATAITLRFIAAPDAQRCTKPLRVSEVVRLKLTDIASVHGLIRVEQGQGRKDRSTLLSTRLLAALPHDRRRLTRSVRHDTIPISLYRLGGAAAQGNHVLSIIGNHDG
jgi:integrase